MNRFIFLFMLCTVCFRAYSLPSVPFVGTLIELKVCYEQPIRTRPVPKSPVHELFVSLDANILYLYNNDYDLTIRLYDEAGNIVYSLYVTAGTCSVDIPQSLSGIFQLELYVNNVFYEGQIEL